ncbi:MAG: hypothetical protein N4A45_03715 [Flavobacteriales bacterium]|jgi:hypothetical protein|nr:hypothetical protein [Flavobacteriales bacterium]
MKKSVIIICLLVFFGGCVTFKKKYQPVNIHFFGKISIPVKNQEIPIPCSVLFYKDTTLMFIIKTDKEGRFHDIYQ